MDGRFSFPVSPAIFRFGSAFGSRTARSLLERNTCTFVCDATGSALTRETESTELWLLTEPELPGDAWLDDAWLSIELELPELWLLAEFPDEDKLEPPE